MIVEGILGVDGDTCVGVPFKRRKEGGNGKKGCCSCVVWLFVLE